MIWNKKRVDYQVYKVKKQNNFLIAYGEVYLTNTATQEVFASSGEYAEPSYNYFCHSSASLDYLNEDCYPISEKKLKKQYPEWHKFFNHYIMEY